MGDVLCGALMMFCVGIGEGREGGGGGGGCPI